MATAILRPHDCLRDQFAPTTIRSANHTVSRATRCRSRKRSPADGNRRSNRESLSTSPPKDGLVMGQVKILKRGEELKPRMFFGEKREKKNLSLDLCSTDRLGPDPETVQMQIRVPDLYAGVSAPPPSSLPFPTALVRRTAMETDLRKLLRI